MMVVRKLRKEFRSCLVITPVAQKMVVSSNTQPKFSTNITEDYSLITTTEMVGGLFILIADNDKFTDCVQINLN